MSYPLIAIAASMLQQAPTPVSLQSDDIVMMKAVYRAVSQQAPERVHITYDI